MSILLKRTIPFLPIVILLLTATITASGVEYCKWTDENGVIHYGENCPEDVKTDTVTTEGKRSESQIKAAEENAKSLEWAPNETAEAIRESVKSKSENNAEINAKSNPQGNKDFSQMSVEQLEVLCEEEREKRLAPEREQLIQDCINIKRMSPGYCERHYSDYGAAANLETGYVRPALYLDLPECVAAWEARRR